MFASAEQVELATLWDELIAGTTKVDSWSHTEETWSIIVSRRPDMNRPPSTLRRRDVGILENALLSGVRKHVAVEVGLSCSSIAVIMQACFQYMGMSCLPSRIPGLLVAAAHARYHRAGRAPSSAPAATSSQLSPRSAPQLRTITISRPDTLLVPWLAPAEYAVIHLLIEGLSYAEIAVERNTSVRTVANQVASGFRRLNVSGRAELLCLLARWGLEPPEPPRKRPPSIAPAQGKRRGSRRSGTREELGSRPQSLSPSLAT